MSDIVKGITESTIAAKFELLVDASIGRALDAIVDASLTKTLMPLDCDLVGLLIQSGTLENLILRLVGNCQQPDNLAMTIKKLCKMTPEKAPTSIAWPHHAASHVGEQFVNLVGADKGAPLGTNAPHPQ